MPDLNVKTGVAVVVSVLVIGLLVATFLPSVIGAFNDGQELTVNQSTSETVELSPDLNATVTAVDDGTNTIDVRVNDTAAGVSDSVSGVGEGNTSTATVDGTDVNVTNNEVTSASSASVTYEYPTGVGWGPASFALFFLMPTLFTIVIALFVVGYVMSVADGL